MANLQFDDLFDTRDFTGEKIVLAQFDIAR
jgi:hypothetical protein